MKNTVHSLLLLIVIGCFIVPYSAEARHRESRVDTSDLADDSVKVFPIPVLFGVSSEQIVPDYGDPRGGGTREHEGQDMRAPKGTPIVSPTEAVVLRTGTGPSAGKYVYTANPGGEVFRYMHLDSIAEIERGDELAVGDFIGTVGDTGNAPDGVYHLHFEVRDEDNDPTDPYPRLGEAFSVKEKMSFLRDIFRDIDDGKEYAAFLVSTFADDFTTALANEYPLPDAVEVALEDTDIVRRQKLLAQLNNIIDSIPTVLVNQLSVGTQGGEVALLQTYLIFRSSGDAHADLRAAGATGYYGPLTAAAVSEWQAANDLVVTGTWGQSEINFAK